MNAISIEESSRRLREVFEKSNFKTQRELSAASGIETPKLNKMMKGTQRISTDHAGALGKALGVSPAYLLFTAAELEISMEDELVWLKRRIHVLEEENRELERIVKNLFVSVKEMEIRK